MPLEGVSLNAVPEQILDVDEALQKLAKENPPVARLVELRYFGGLTLEEAAVHLTFRSELLSDTGFTLKRG